MRADASIRIRVPKGLKAEWRDHAKQAGVHLSDLIRTACRLSVLLGHQRMAGSLGDISGMRRDLHAAGADLRRIAEDNPHLSQDELRKVLARVHMVADAISAAIRPGRSP